MSEYRTPRDVIFELLTAKVGYPVPWTRAEFCKAHGQLLYKICEKLGLDIDSNLTTEYICPWVDPHTNPGVES